MGEGGDSPFDVFLIAPMTDMGDDGNLHMSLSDPKSRGRFLGALNMERGIYDGTCRLFAPYYRQATQYALLLGGEETEACLAAAYADVRAAFLFYMENGNAGRPFILAGFSQGADMCLRLMKDAFADGAYDDRFVAAYALGWRLTREDCATYPWLTPAGEEDDTGVIVTFNSETEAATGTMMVPEGTWTYSINPLNWRTDGTPASAEENLGACFTNYDGGVDQEIPALCGCYIDDARGTLKVTGVTVDEYPTRLDSLGEGSFHLYDYQFFYRNLQRNVAVRAAAWTNRH